MSLSNDCQLQRPPPINKIRIIPSELGDDDDDRSFEWNQEFQVL